MKSFYTLIKFSPNTVSSDTLSIGLLLFDGQKYHLKFSKERISLCKKLIDHNVKTLDFVVSNIESYIKELNLTISRSESELFSFKEILSSEKFIYFAKYSNGIIQFSEPNIIADIDSSENFKKLFSVLIDDDFEKNSISKSNFEKQFFHRIKSELISQLKDQININAKFTPEVLPSIHFNFEMDCIGLNGAYVGAKAVSFDQSYQTIDKEISHYGYLMYTLSLNNNKAPESNNFYLIADEPQSVKSEEFRLWEKIHKSSAYKIVSSEETAIIVDKVKSTNAKPLEIFSF